MIVHPPIVPEPWIVIEHGMGGEARRATTTTYGSAVPKRGSSNPATGAGQPPAYPIASVDSALRLLKLFRDMPRVRLSEAAEHLGVAHSTAHRLMAI